MTIKWYKEKIEKHCKKCGKHTLHKVSVNYDTQQIKLVCEECGFLNENNVYDATKFKFCPRCMKIKDRDLFHVNESARDKRQAYCKECNKVYLRERYHERKAKKNGQVTAPPGNSGNSNNNSTEAQKILNTMQEEAVSMTKSQKAIDKINDEITELEKRLDKILARHISQEDFLDITHLSIGIRYLKYAKEQLE